MRNNSLTKSRIASKINISLRDNLTKTNYFSKHKQTYYNDIRDTYLESIINNIHYEIEHFRSMLLISTCDKIEVVTENPLIYQLICTCKNVFTSHICLIYWQKI